MSRVKSRGWLVVNRTRRIPCTWPTAASNSANVRFPFRVAVAVHVLSKQLDLRVAQLGDAPRLIENRRRSAAALLAACIRHNAERAKLVASFNDRDVAAIRILPGSELRLECLFRLPVVQSRDPVLARLQPRQHLREFPIRRRPRDQRHIRRPLEDLFALLLRHAAQNAEALPLLVQLLEVVQAIEDLLLRLVADRTGVIENQPGIFFRLHPPVSLLLQRANHLFGVVGVHLAAEGL